jgi:hypothetical protein
MPDLDITQYDVRPDLGLGRHMVLDERSLAYRRRYTGDPLHPIEWAPKIPVLNQQNLLSQGIHTSTLFDGVDDLDALGSCFPAGTRVRMADGSERAIEDVRLGEEVVTAEGNTGSVAQTMIRQHFGHLVKVRIWGHSHLRCTPEHPILTARGYVQAGDLQQGDRVAFPRYMAEQVTAIVPNDYIRVPQSAAAHKLPSKIELNENTGRLFGTYLAEGSCDASKVRWTFGNHEQGHRLVEETVRLLAAEWGVTAHVKEREGLNSINVTLFGTAWARLFTSLTGTGAIRKKVHPHLSGGPRDFQAAMIDGWLAGDGYVRADGGTAGSTISADLALAMYDIAQALGRRPVITVAPGKVNSAAKERQPSWTVTMAKNPADHTHNYSTQDDRHVWRAVREISTEEFSGPVYNLHVQGDESYVAEGVGVHNCTANAATALVSVLHSADTLAQYGLNTADPVAAEMWAIGLYADATTKDQWHDSQWPAIDCGSSGLGVAKALKDHGLIDQYGTATTAEELCQLLQTGPVLMGMPWHDAFSSPVGGQALLDEIPNWQASPVAGGHEVCITALETVALDETNGGLFYDHTVLRVQNSWSSSWGDAGSFRMSLALYQALRPQIDLVQPRLESR